MIDTHALVQEFRRSVIDQVDAIRSADPTAGNKHAKRYVLAFHRLRTLGNQGRDALTVLLDDESPDVRVAAACFLLRHCEDRARTLLERESDGSGLAALRASEALKRWEEGTWMLDPAE